MSTFRIVYLVDSGEIPNDLDPVKEVGFVQAETYDDALEVGFDALRPLGPREHLVNWYAFDASGDNPPQTRG